MSNHETSPAEAELEQCSQAASACACFNLRKASRAVSKMYDEALQPIGLRSTQFVTLLAIRLRQPVGLSALSDEMVADRSTLSRNLKLLENAGLIEAESPRGGRKRVFCLSAAGAEKLEQGLPLWREVQERFVSQIGQQQWDVMLSGLSEAVDAAEITP